MQKLYSRAVWFFFGSRGVSLLFVALVVIPALSVDPELESQDVLLVVIAFLAVAVVFFIWNLVVSKLYQFELEEKELFIEFGVFNRKNINIPYARVVRNVNIYRNFWARILGLSELQIQTAGSSNIEGKIPAIGKEDAEKIREDLLVRAGARNEGI